MSADTGMIISAEGVIERGVVCPQIRLEDGRKFTLYGLSMPRWKLVRGLRVRLSGKRTDTSKCQQGEALQIRSLEILADP